MRFFAAFLFFFLVSASSLFAEGDFGDESVSPSLRELRVTGFESTGFVIKKSENESKVSYLVGLPATIYTGSPCVHYAGQETLAYRTPIIRVLGAYDVTQDVCITLMPLPVSTALTLNMQGKSEETTLRATIIVNNHLKAEKYLVLVDTSSDTVEIFKYKQ